MERFTKTIPRDRIIGGSAFIDSRLQFTGDIVHRSQEPRIVLGTFPGSRSEMLVPVSEAFNNSDVTCQVTKDLLNALWMKCIFVLLGTSTGVVNASIGSVVSNEWLNDTLEVLAGEISKVAQAEGIRITSDEVEEEVPAIRKMRPEWKSLLTEDLESGSKTELESLWAYLVRRAEDRRVETPISRLVYGALKLREGNYIEPLRKNRVGV